jgi:hypothetical protein
MNNLLGLASLAGMLTHKLAMFNNASIIRFSLI